MGYRGRLLNEVVQVLRKTTTDDGVGGKIPDWNVFLTRYHCRIFKPAAETSYQDEGMRDESILVMMGLKKHSVRTGDKIIRDDDTELIVVNAKRPRCGRDPYFRKYWLREIQRPPFRPGMD